MFMNVTELLHMLGHDPDQVQWQHIKLPATEPDLFLVWKSTGFRKALCLAYAIVKDGPSVTFTLKSMAAFDPTLRH